MKEVNSPFFLFVLLGVASSTLSAKCPPENKISPCRCADSEEDVDLQISCGYEMRSLNDAKRTIKSLDKSMTYAIELEDIEIGTLPHNLFEGLKVKQLTISHCKLDALAEDGRKALTGLENSLEELNIYTSFLEENGNTKLEVSHLRVLAKLDLSYNTITELGNEWFEKGPASLTHLILSNNGIEKLGNKAFKNLVNVRELWLDGNRFGPILKSMLPSPANHLEGLQLDNNAFTSIPEDLFLGMPILKSVSLRTNGISQIPQKTWQPVWEQLEWLDFRGNPLTCDSHIDWIFHTNTLAEVSGRCIAPKDRQGMDLEDLVNLE